MKRWLMIAVAAVTLSMSSSDSAEARGNRGYRNGNGDGPLSRMVEMERRKNAWLRRTFLGR